MDSVPHGAVEYKFKGSAAEAGRFVGETRTKLASLFRVTEIDPKRRVLLDGITSFQGKDVTVTLSQSKSGRVYWLTFSYDPGLCELMNA